MTGALRTCCAAALAALLAAPASAELFLFQSGQDSSPYAFLPDLPRGARNSAYAFTNDIGGEDHSFEYFIQFDLPEDLLGPGEIVTEAYAWVYYGFDYTIFDDTTEFFGEIRCSPVLEPWNEIDLTWNNRPDKGPVFDAIEEIDTLGQYWCDLTELVQQWATGVTENHGIAITSQELRVMGFWTFDDGTVGPNFKPSLVVRTALASGDSDGDGVLDATDSCPSVPNPGQHDRDLDAVGDVCDVCPTVFDPDQQDTDGDGTGDACDAEAFDLDGDGSVRWSDYAAFQRGLGNDSVDPGYDPRCDMDGDESITLSDRALWLPLFSAHSEEVACGLLGIEPFLTLAALGLAGRRRTRKERSCSA